MARSRATLAMIEAAAIENARDGNFDALPMCNGVDPATLYGPLSNDAIAPDGNWESANATSDAERRAACPWDAKV